MSNFCLRNVRRCFLWFILRIIDHIFLTNNCYLFYRSYYNHVFFGLKLKGWLAGKCCLSKVDLSACARVFLPLDSFIYSCLGLTIILYQSNSLSNKALDHIECCSKWPTIHPPSVHNSCQQCLSFSHYYQKSSHTTLVMSSEVFAITWNMIV